MNPGAPSPEKPQSPQQHSRGAHPRCVDSEELLRGERELHIRHGDEVYRLMITRNGKLILQK